MSLFDILRYPVTDIYNKDELDALPEDLYREWITACHFGEDIKLSADRYTDVKALVELQVIKSTRLTASHRHAGWAMLWKARFTVQLKETIKNYDTN